MVTQRIDYRAQNFGVAVGELSLGNEFQHFGQFGVALDVGSGPVAFVSTSSTSCSFSPNEKKFSAPASSSTHVGAVERADGQRTVDHELHVSGSRGFLACCGDCSDRFAAG